MVYCGANHHQHVLEYLTKSSEDNRLPSYDKGILLKDMN